MSGGQRSGWHALACVLCFSFLTAFLTFASSTAFAQDAERLLGRDVMSSVKTMPKDVHIYHYFNIKDLWVELKTPDGRANYVTRYLTDVTGRFWDLNYHAAAYINAGPGVYLAIDPYVAYVQNFGNTMIELVVPKGTRFINVVRPIPIGQDTLNALVKEGIIASHQASFIFYKAGGPTKLGFYRDTLKNMTNPGYEKFRSTVLRIFQTNAIQWIEYNWDTRLSGFCNPKSASAFNYVGMTPWDLKYAGIPMMSTLPFPLLTASEQELSTRVVKFRDLLGQIDSMRKRGIKIPPSIVSSVYTPAEYKQIKDMTYSCD